MLVENALFATLDPTVRRAETADGRRLHARRHRRLRPRTCRTSWSRRSARRWRRSADADLVLHVVDGSHPDPEGQISRPCARCSPRSAATSVPEIVVVNKADAADPEVLDRLRAPRDRTASSSPPAPARASTSCSALIAEELPRPDGRRSTVLLPYDRGDLVTRLHQEAEVLSSEHTEDGTRVEAGSTGSWSASSAPSPSEPGAPRG